MLSKPRMMMLALGLVLSACACGRYDSGADALAVDALAADASATEAALSDTVPGVRDSGFDQIPDQGRGDRWSVEADGASGAKDDAAVDRAPEVASMDALITDARTADTMTADVTPTDATPADVLATDTSTADTQPLPDAGCTMLDNIPGNLPSISFGEYHTLPQMLDYLQALAAAVPNLAQYKVLGQSKQGRDLGTLVINATCQPSPPAIFFNGAHHGDEGVSAEAVLAIPDHLLRQSASDVSVRGLLQSYAFAILPVVNPDGLVSNTRTNADGLDINRDYPFPGRSETLSFKTGEALLIKSLQESMGFAGAVTFHSGAEEVIWPWCYTGTATDDDAFFHAAGKKTAAAMGFAIYQQSFDDYPTQGEYIDYAYAKSRTLAATFEVSNLKQPSASALAGVVDNARKGAMAWAQAVSDHALGRLHALPAGPRPRFPFTTPFDERGRLE